MHPRAAAVFAYHERTKHHFGRYARALGYMDWATQPDPFRRFEGAPLERLEQVPAAAGPGLSELQRALPPAPLDRAFVSQLLYDALALSAWKAAGDARWPLRCNPSSGNLHPTEGYLLLPELPGLEGGLFHYAPKEHGLERRASPSWEGPPLLGLTAIHWRESWKYGERAFRYCQLDSGHAVAALSYAAAALGWRLRLLEEASDPAVAALLGIDRQQGPEAEHPDALLVLFPADREPPALGALPEVVPRLDRPAPLSASHHPWPVIPEVASACLKWEPPEATFFDVRPSVSGDGGVGPDARTLFHQRRSAVSMDGESSIGRDAFLALLRRCLPSSPIPFAALPWRPAVHLLLQVHRVDGLERGLYLLVRDPGAEAGLRSALSDRFDWASIEGAPLLRLASGDQRPFARQVSCGQDIAADGAFAVSMLAEFEPRIASWPFMYRRLHLEAGAIGQVLYLEAEAAGLRGTGIGCFFDDAIHEHIGLRGRRWQVLYNFTVGGPVHDSRLATLPAYHHLG